MNIKDKIKHWWKNSDDKNLVILKGKWGTGKTYLINEIIDATKKREKTKIISLGGMDLDRLFLELYANKFSILSTVTKDRVITWVGVNVPVYSGGLEIALNPKKQVNKIKNSKLKSKNLNLIKYLILDDYEASKITTHELIWLIEALQSLENPPKLILIYNSTSLSNNNKSINFHRIEEKLNAHILKMPNITKNVIKNIIPYITEIKKEANIDLENLRILKKISSIYFKFNELYNEWKNTNTIKKIPKKFINEFRNNEWKWIILAIYYDKNPNEEENNSILKKLNEFKRLEEKENWSYGNKTTEKSIKLTTREEVLEYLKNKLKFYLSSFFNIILNQKDEISISKEDFDILIYDSWKLSWWMKKIRNDPNFKLNPDDIFKYWKIKNDNMGALSFTRLNTFIFNYFVLCYMRKQKINIKCLEKTINSFFKNFENHKKAFFKHENFDTFKKQFLDNLFRNEFFDLSDILINFDQADIDDFLKNNTYFLEPLKNIYDNSLEKLSNLKTEWTSDSFWPGHKYTPSDEVKNNFINVLTNNSFEKIFLKNNLFILNHPIFNYEKGYFYKIIVLIYFLNSLDEKWKTHYVKKIRKCLPQIENENIKRQFYKHEIFKPINANNKTIYKT